MVEFFGSVDRNKRGEVASEMPAWFFDYQIDELEEDIARKNREISRGEIPPEHFQMKKNEVKNLQGKLDEINNSRPKLQGGQKTQFANAFFDLKNKISDSMPTRMEDRRGYVSPREELARCKTPHIQIDPVVAKACGIKLKNGKATGDQAAKAYKMIGKQLGENINVERLRKEGKSEAQGTIDELTKYIMDNKITR